MPSSSVRTLACVLLATVLGGCGSDSEDAGGGASTETGDATGSSGSAGSNGSSGASGSTSASGSSGASGSTTDSSSSGASGSTGTSSTSGGSGSTSGSNSTAGSSSSATSGSSSTGTGGGDCDDEVGDNGVLMFEAESLPLVEDWQVSQTEPGYYGTGYIQWEGPSFNGRPGSGLIERALRFDQAGRYRVQWRTRIGLGTNATEHNDIWLKFPDVADYYGKAGDDPETRRYPKPQCDDAAFIAGIEALPQVSEAACAAGSTSDGWLKVYSSGATDWRWSARTSDNDAHDIYIEVAEPGVYTLQFSARADFMLLDRVVIHRESVPESTAQAEDQPETPCE